MRSNFLILLSACATLAGCSGEAPSENAELQAELDRLENEIGKLEFRVYELEQTVLATEPATQNSGAAPPEPVADDAAESRVPAGSYDLTPVE